MRYLQHGPHHRLECAQLVSDVVETRLGRTLTGVATNTTRINTDTKYTTLQHVPSRRASLWAVGSLVADCHVSSKHKAGLLRRGGLYYEEEVDGRILIVFAVRIEVSTSSVIEKMFGWRVKTERKTRLVSMSSPLIEYTRSMSTRHCSYYSFVEFFDDDDNDNKCLALI